jgi:hypothetical protein
MKQREGITAQRRRPRFPWRRSAASSELLWKSEMRLRTDKSGDTVGRPSCRSLLLGDPGAKFLVEQDTLIEQMKNSLNSVSTCLRVVDTRRAHFIQMFLQLRFRQSRVAVQL